MSMKKAATFSSPFAALDSTERRIKILKSKVNITEDEELESI